MWGRRPDGTLVRDLSALRRFMPFISPKRNHSVVYFAQEVDVEAALALVNQYNQSRPRERRLTLFHLLLRGIAQVLEERPRLNRFVAGSRIWQRDGIWITFSTKIRMDDQAPLSTVKLRIDPTDSVDRMVDQIHEALRDRRSGRKDTSDREVDFLLRLPPFLLRLGVRLVAALDAWGLWPGAAIRSTESVGSIRSLTVESDA